MKTVIMAGGKGTRISSVNADVPKPMIPILDKPILQYQLECLSRQGYTDIILSIGYLGHIIRNYFGDGSNFHVKIRYLEEKEPLGTAGALVYLKEELTDDFLLINGDIIFDVDLQRFYASHKKAGGTATIFTHPSGHPYDSGIIEADSTGKVINWLHKEDDKGWYKNRVNAGLHMLSPGILDLFDEPRKTDLDRDILHALISDGKLFAYDSPEYVKDMGTPERYFSVVEDVRNGIVSEKNLRNKQKAVFLDRDGTINVCKGFLTNIDDFELIEGAADAVRRINESGRLAIVVTNQPVIARGEVSIADLQKIHNKMETLLGREGAYLDAVFYCPHHPDKGYEGERPEYKIDCSCRKPKPGMLFTAAEKFNIDLRESYMIGDSDSDVEAGRKAECIPLFIGKNDNPNSPSFANLQAAVDFIFDRK